MLALLILTITAECKGEQKGEETLIHKVIKVGFWLLLGVTLGVYFQARLNLKEKAQAVIDVVLYGLFIGVAVYTLYSVEQLVR